jgi:hypothetical protein
VRQVENNTKEFTNAQLQVDDSSNTRPSTNTYRMQSTSRKWSKSEADILKANSDANLSHLGTWGLGSIVRDEHGMIMASATWRYGGFDCATTAEAFAILSTMKLAQQCGFRRMMFESDNEKVIKLLQHKDVFHRSYLGSMFREMLKLGSGYEICRFSFSHRECNRVARILLFTQTVLLIPKVKVENAPTHVNMR